MLIILSIIIVIILIYVFFTYNSIIKLNNQVKEAFSTMDVYLKKRWDLIPNIVEVVKGYAKYEKDTLIKITEFRKDSYNSMSDFEKIDINSKISSELNKLIIIEEKYPDLKADKVFLDLNHQLSQIEDEIAKSRKYYNGAVKVYNTKIEMFPSNLIASIFGFKEKEMFKVDYKEKEDVKVDLEENI